MKIRDAAKIFERIGVAGYNKPKRTPNHPTKSHVVVAKEGDQVKTIRFGQQGEKGSPDGSARNKAFKARHAKNIARGKMSGSWWSDKVKWAIIGIMLSGIYGTYDTDNRQQNFAAKWEIYSRV
jgi:hypothetical protein